MKFKLDSTFGGFNLSSKMASVRGDRRSCGEQFDGNAAQQTFASLTVLAQACASALAQVDTAMLGRFSNDGSCSYDCGFREQDWNWWFDFTGQKAISLQPRVGASDIQQPFTVAYGPSAAWVATDIPSQTTAINQLIATILAIDAAIIQAGGHETPQQADALRQAFANLTSDSDSALDTMNAALQQLSAYLSWVSPTLGGLAAFCSALQKSNDAQIAGWCDNLIGQIACGDGDVRGQFAAAQIILDAAFATLYAAFAAVDTAALQSLRTASVLPGLLVNLQSDFAIFDQQVSQAHGYAPTSPLRTMHLNIAKTSWAELASYAETNLAN